MSETTSPVPPPPPKQDGEEAILLEDLPPLRLHATRVPERLSSSSSLPNTPSQQQQPHKHVRRRSFDRQNKNNPRSRSKSPSLQQDQTATTTNMDGSLSSLEDFVDSDILTDSKGMKELCLEEEERKSHSLSQKSSGSLAPVHERMSEETLEDVHAFSDINIGNKTPSLSSRGNSTVGTAGDVGSYLLETLDECEEEEDHVIDDEPKGEVIFTNMENLTIHEEIGGGSDIGGDTSLELSSAPATFKTV